MFANRNIFAGMEKTEKDKSYEINKHLKHKLVSEFLQYLEDSSDSEDEIDNIDINKVKEPENYIGTFCYPEYIDYINEKINTKKFINYKQNTLGINVTKLNMKYSFDNLTTFKRIGNSENVYFQKTSQDYSYLNYFDEDQITQLLPLACKSGYYELVQELIAMNIDVDKPTFKEHCTALMEAAKIGQVDIVHLLLSHGANVNAHSATKNSPLIYGCAGGHEEVVRILLEAGANVEHYNEDGCTPLKAAAKIGHVPIVKMLLEHGAIHTYNTYSKEFKESALILACYKGHLEIVRLLLEAGISQKNETSHISLALAAASIGGHAAVARLLIDAGAQVNISDQLLTSYKSPLWLAACRGHTELVKLLLDQGAHINENNASYNPLIQAAREGHVETVALLLSRVNNQKDGTMETALKLACCGGYLKVVDYLLKANVNIDHKNLTPLMVATAEGHLNIVRYLLESGANVEAETKSGKTALMYACENGHTDIVKLLLLFGAKLEKKSKEGATPLMKACAAGHFDTVQYLISMQANVNCETICGQTPLTLASMAGHITIVALLLDHGANRKLKFKDKTNTVMRTTICNQLYTTELLLMKPQIYRTYKYNYGRDNDYIFGNYFHCWNEMVQRRSQYYNKRKTTIQKISNISEIITKNVSIIIPKIRKT